MSYRYYLEHFDIAPDHPGNVIIVPLDVHGQPMNPYSDRPDICEIIAATQYYPNSPVRRKTCPIEYLTEQCRVVDEAQARQIHPRIFQYLEASPLERHKLLNEWEKRDQKEDDEYWDEEEN